MLANDPSRNRPGLLVWAALALIVFSASGITVAQQGAWEPVPADELALKDEPKAPGASAIILFRSLAIDDKRGTLTESTRIKVLTDAGKKYADIAIPTAKWMKVEEVEARTVGRDGSSVPFSGAIHDVTVAKTRKYGVEMKSLTLPDVGPGTIIEYRYRMHWKAEDLPSHTWDIQSELFTRRAHFELASKPGSPIHWVARNWQQGPPQSNGTLFTLEVFNVLALEKEDHTLPESELRAAVDFFYTYPPYDTQESFWSRYAEYYGVELAISSSGTTSGYNSSSLVSLLLLIRRRPACASCTLALNRCARSPSTTSIPRKPGANTCTRANMSATSSSTITGPPLTLLPS